MTSELSSRNRNRVIRVLQFAEVINRYDNIDTIVQWADRRQFQLGVCVRSTQSQIATPVYDVSMPQWLLSNTSRRAIPRAALGLARLLRANRIDIVHTHGYDQAVIGWLATRLHRGTRLVVERHYSDSLYRLPAGVKRRLLLGIEQTVNRAADRIIVPSCYIREILTERQGISPGKVERFPYGFAPEKYAAPDEAAVQRVREEFGLEECLALGSFGRLHEEKGHRFLLQAIARLRPDLPQLRLLIVGEGPERAGLEQQIRQLDIEASVRLVGWRRDAMTVMAAVDAVVQPTLQEAFSQVMVEALWMRKPLVITDVSGAPDIIRDGENGLLVPKAEVEALAAAIHRLAMDPLLGSRVGAAGRAYVEEHLTIEKVIHRYEQAYLRTVEAGLDTSALFHGQVCS